MLVSTVSNLVSDYIHLNRLKNGDNEKLYIVNNNETPFDYFANKNEVDLSDAFEKVLKYKTKI